MRREPTDHARWRMTQRGISESRVWAVIDTGKRRHLKRGRWAARAVVDGIDTEVIWVIERDTTSGEDVMVVITCYDERSERWRPVVKD